MRCVLIERSSIYLIASLSSSLDKNGKFHCMVGFSATNLVFFCFSLFFLDCTFVLSFGYDYFSGLPFNLLVSFLVMYLLGPFW